MSALPLISIILTTYNRSELLSETVRSILDQSCKDFELIIVDNFSGYNFSALIDSFNDNRIRAFQNDNQGVIAVNRNYGIKRSIGKYLAFCDDDDLWAVNKLAAQLEYIRVRNLQGNFLLYSNTYCFGDSINTFLTKKKKIQSVNDLIRCNEITYSTVFLTNSEVIFFDEEESLVAVEDYALWLRLQNEGFDFYLMAASLVNYRVNSNSQLRISSEHSHLKRMYAIIKFLLSSKSEINIITFFITFLIQLLKFSAKRRIKGFSKKANKNPNYLLHKL